MSATPLVAESLEQLYEEAPCGYLTVLPDGVIARVNKTFLAWTGYSADELYSGKRFSALLTKPGALLYETHCTPLLRLRGSIGEIAFDILCQDGKPLPVLFSAVVQRDQAGAIALLRIVVLNAPTRREYERELLRARTQAEDATEQVRIHRELAERKVVEQQQLLEAVARMAAGDLQTPVIVETSSSQAPLAKALDQMRRDIQKQIRELNDRNTEIQLLNAELRHQIEQRSNLLIEWMEAELRPRAAASAVSASAKAQSLLPNGMVLADRYRIEGILGQGAMGTVYEVQRISDDRRFAAKVLNVKPDLQAMVRFAREAQLLARLQHPNLLAILDVDVTVDRVAYIVMELLRGKSLADFGARYGDIDFMLPVLRQVADALTAVHAAGVVHRDLKPGNVLISASSDGTEALAKLVDFGISRLLDHQPEATSTGSSTGPAPDLGALLSNSPGFGQHREDTLQSMQTDTLPPTSTLGLETDESITAPRSQPSSSPGPMKRRRGSSDGLTQLGEILGTPRYMAPELFLGANLARPHADIFSFGVMAYEVLTGALPFEEPPLLLAARGIDELRFEPLHALCAGLAPELASLLERCLAIDPTRRPTAGELYASLGRHTRRL